MYVMGFVSVVWLLPFLLYFFLFSKNVLCSCVSFFLFFAFILLVLLSFLFNYLLFSVYPFHWTGSIREIDCAIGHLFQNNIFHFTIRFNINSITIHFHLTSQIVVLKLQKNVNLWGEFWKKIKRKPISNKIKSLHLVHLFLAISHQWNFNSMGHSKTVWLLDGFCFAFRFWSLACFSGAHRFKSNSNGMRYSHALSFSFIQIWPVVFVFLFH